MYAGPWRASIGPVTSEMDVKSKLFTYVSYFSDSEQEEGSIDFAQQISLFPSPPRNDNLMETLLI